MVEDFEITASRTLKYPGVTFDENIEIHVKNITVRADKVVRET